MWQIITNSINTNCIFYHAMLTWFNSSLKKLKNTQFRNLIDSPGHFGSVFFPMLWCRQGFVLLIQNRGMKNWWCCLELFVSGRYGNKRIWCLICLNLVSGLCEWIQDLVPRYWQNTMFWCLQYESIIGCCLVWPQSHFHSINDSVWIFALLLIMHTY